MPTRQELANAIRFLAMDAVQQANSGHPGMPMGMADIAEVLWNDFLKHNPKNPRWMNRDRFILSNGHGSMLQYSLLHLTGYDLSMDELRNFRQLHSKTPGHPEVDEAPGIETTTGPLGQGIANGVGMAIAEKILAAQFNTSDQTIIDHYTYVFAGDGCLMEGVSHESCSLAGTWGLGKLILFWDDNKISIDGNTEGWFTTDTPKRFEAYDWQVIRDVDGHDPDQIKKAIETAQKEKNRPTIICCKTNIGQGSPSFAGTAKTHGAPLGAEEINLTRDHLNWPHNPFETPDEIEKAWDATEKGEASEQKWQAIYTEYKAKNADLAKELERRLSGDLPQDFSSMMESFLKASQEEHKDTATRKASAAVIEKVAKVLPELLGGSADLTGSNLTNWSGTKAVTKEDANANYINYGVREFGMSAIMNGIALHGGFIPYAGTFLVFQTYAANAVRMSALMKQRVIYIYTHDSIGLGEDGPTHQPVVETAVLRMTPNMSVWRPCDMAETVVAWESALESAHGPTSLLLSRQTLPAQIRDAKALSEIKKGGYTLKECSGEPELILMATGSEVELAMQAAEQLKEMQVRVVSMPCCEHFDAQNETYRNKVLPRGIRKIAIEAASSAPWYKYVGSDGAVIGLDRFGASAPAKEVYQECGITVEAIVDKALSGIPASVS